MVTKFSQMEAVLFSELYYKLTQGTKVPLVFGQEESSLLFLLPLVPAARNGWLCFAAWASLAATAAQGLSEMSALCVPASELIPPLPRAPDLPSSLVSLLLCFLDDIIFHDTNRLFLDIKHYGVGGQNPNKLLWHFTSFISVTVVKEMKEVFV